MEIRNIHNDADWAASYEKSDQIAALIKCQKLKIKQLTDIINTIQGELELCEEPKEYSFETIINSIKVLANKIPEVSFTKGYFKWEG